MAPNACEPWPLRVASHGPDQMRAMALAWQLDDEIVQVNWGASFIEGASALSIAFILTLYIPGEAGLCD